MNVQSIAFAVFLLVSLLIVAVFAFVAASTDRERTVDPQAAYRLRKYFALALTALLVASLAYTLPRLPYPTEAQVPDQVVFVAAKQFAFGLSAAPLTSEAQWEEASSGPLMTVKAGSLVEFRVSSLDVNHGFGVYTAEGVMLAQTQAMPGYVNRLRLRLDKPGRYQILCLELCGMQHHEMRGAFEVR